jgi:hypothetical protein
MKILTRRKGTRLFEKKEKEKVTFSVCILL